MEEKRNWRDAKIPQWVKDSIAEEIDQWELTAALSWPTEPKPQPVFWGAGYGQVGGTPEAGEFWRKRGSWEPEKVTVTLASTRPKVIGSDGSISTGEVFFRSKEDAHLHTLWEQCEAYAKELVKLRRRLR